MNKKKMLSLAKDVIQMARSKADCQLLKASKTMRVSKRGELCERSGWQ